MGSREVPETNQAHKASGKVCCGLKVLGGGGMWSGLPLVSTVDSSIIIVERMNPENEAELMVVIEAISPFYILDEEQCN